jgi:hypothetical protein
MKTAEEWSKIINASDVCCTSEGGGLWESQDTYKLIKQIQLDAIKEGMRRAAKLAQEEYEVRHQTKGQCAANEAILTAAEHLTEKDLV